MKMRRVGALVLLILVVVTAAWLLLGRDRGSAHVVKASGTIEGTEADLGFQAAGRIAAIGVREGESVASGAELARLDMADVDALRAAANAQAAAARAQLAELTRGARPEEIAQAVATEQAARERMEIAQRTRDRLRALHEGGAVSRQTLDEAATAYEVANAQLEQAREQTRLVREGPRRERLDAQRAVVEQAAAMIAQAEAAASHAVIRAPFAGIVAVRHREPGEAVSPGAPVLTVLNPADRWVRIYVREDVIGRVVIGQRAEIRTDSDPETTYRGRVTFIASNAEFTPRNVQTAEERVKLVYAVKVSIEGDEGMMLKPGIPADVTLLPES